MQRLSKIGKWKVGRGLESIATRTFRIINVEGRSMAAVDSRREIYLTHGQCVGTSAANAPTNV